MAEAAGGARALGARLRVLDQLTPATLAALLREARPQVLVTHRIDDVHPDHRHAAQCALAALPEAVIATGHPLRVYTCDSYESLTLGGQVAGAVVVDVTSTFPVKMRAPDRARAPGPSPTTRRRSGPRRCDAGVPSRLLGAAFHPDVS